MSCDAWITKGVLGERVFLNRKAVPISDGFVYANWLTTAAALAFSLLALFGLVVGDFWLGFVALHAVVVAKLWFVDRCAWLFEVMKDRHPVYRAWADADWSARLDPAA